MRPVTRWTLPADVAKRAVVAIAAVRRGVFATCAVAALVGCAALRQGTAEPAPVPAAPVVASPAPRPAVEAGEALPPAAFAEAVTRSVERLLVDARQALGTAPRQVVVDPPIDAASGQQTLGTVSLGERIAALVGERAPGWTVRPLTRASVAERPLLVLGTLTPLRVAASATQPVDAFRLCVAIVDLRTGQVVARRLDRATAGSVNAEPTPFHRDSPTWSLDRTTRAYVRSCHDTVAGVLVAVDYLLRLPAAAVLAEAQHAYGAGRMPDALRLFQEARRIAEPDDLRVWNGLYLASWRSNRRKDAAEAFSRIVTVGLDARRLPVKLFFQPGTTRYAGSAEQQAQYAAWLREIVLQADLRETCMKVTGHTSRTGPAAVNEALSLRRAQQVRQQVMQISKAVGERMTAEGVGSREAVADLGTDDARDALDRRVEFRIVDCA